MKTYRFEAFSSSGASGAFLGVSGLLWTCSEPLLPLTRKKEYPITLGVWDIVLQNQSQTNPEARKPMIKPIKPYRRVEKTKGNHCKTKENQYKTKENHLKIKENNWKTNKNYQN